MDDRRMSQLAASGFIPFSDVEQLREARDILRHASQALADLSKRLDTSFTAAVRSSLRCRSRLA